jgi:chemotaxis protein MotB
MRTIIALLAISLASGCVGKKKYMELESAYAKLEKKQTRTEAKSDKQLDALLVAVEDMMRIKKRGLAEVSIEDGRAVIGLDADVLFASGSADLTPEGRAAIKALAPVLAQSQGQFQVEGHTDNDPIRTALVPNNWHLGADRSIAVVTELVKSGVPASRLSASSYAQFQPVTANSGASAKAQNRRIEIAYMPELAEVLPYRQILDHGLEKREVTKKGKTSGKKG